MKAAPSTPRAAATPFGGARTPLRAENAHCVRQAQIPFPAHAPANPRRGTESAPYLSLRALATLLAALLFAPAAAAHPVHTSHADADFNAATGRLEISLRVIASDLLAALQAEAGDGAPELSWEKTDAAELDRLLFAYLRPRFRFLDAAGRELPLQWVGRDADHDDDGQRAWFYFEVGLPGGPEGARVEHRLLLDRVPGQLNTVRIRHGGRSVTLSFAPGQGPRPIAFPAPGAKK